MTTIAFKAGRIDHINTYGSNSSEFELDMNDDQMFDLVAAIQNRVGYRVWDEIVARLDPDSPPRTEAFASDGSALA